MSEIQSEHTNVCLVSLQLILVWGLTTRLCVERHHQDPNPCSQSSVCSHPPLKPLYCFCRLRSLSSSELILSQALHGVWKSHKAFGSLPCRPPLILLGFCLSATFTEHPGNDKPHPLLSWRLYGMRWAGIQKEPKQVRKKTRMYLFKSCQTCRLSCENNLKQNKTKLGSFGHGPLDIIYLVNLQGLLSIFHSGFWKDSPSSLGAYYLWTGIMREQVSSLQDWTAPFSIVRETKQVAGVAGKSPAPWPWLFWNTEGAKETEPDWLA